MKRTTALVSRPIRPVGGIGIRNTKCGMIKMVNLSSEYGFEESLRSFVFKNFSCFAFNIGISGKYGIA